MRVSTIKIITCCAVIFWLGACADEQQKSDNQPKLSIEIVHPAELRPALSILRERFNTAKRSLSDGRQITVELRSEGALAAATGFASGEIKSTAWIAPGQAFVEYANTKTHNLGAQLTDCTTLFSTPIVYVQREPIVAEAVDHSESALDQLQDIKFSHGSPKDSSSVLGAIQQLLATAPKSKLVDPIEVLRQREQQAYRYDPSESALLEELASAQRPQRHVVITSEQVALNFNKGRTAALQILYPKAGSAMLDYRLCLSSGDWVTAAHRAAIDELRNFFQSADAQAPFADLGFRTAVTTATSGETRALPVIEHTLAQIDVAASSKIIDGWREIRRPSSVVFVLDTSGSTDSGLLSEMRSALRLSLARAASRDLRALVVFSSEATSLGKFGVEPEALIHALDTLRSAGGAALYDAIKLAISEFDDPRSNGSRRSILVVTDSIDKNSSASSEALKISLEQLASKDEVQLVVLAVPSQGENVDQLASFVKSLGGTFRVAELSQAGAVFDELVASIE